MSAQPKVTIPRVESWLTSNELDYELDSDSSIDRKSTRLNSSHP